MMKQAQALIGVEMLSPQATRCQWDRQLKIRASAGVVPMQMVSLVQLPMVGVWSEGYAICGARLANECRREGRMNWHVSRSGSSKMLEVLACRYAGFNRR